MSTTTSFRSVNNALSRPLLQSEVANCNLYTVDSKPCARLRKYLLVLSKVATAYVFYTSQLVQLESDYTPKEMYFVSAAISPQSVSLPCTSKMATSCCLMLWHEHSFISSLTDA